MLIAHQAVSNKISSVKDSIGNTITIAPAGFSGFSQVNNSLTTAQLAKVQALPHVTNVAETLTDRLTTIGSTSPSSFFNQSSSGSSSANNMTSLTSPVTISTGASGSGSGSGPQVHLFISGGGQLPTNFSPPVSIEGTNDPTQLNGTALTITSGTAISGTSSSDNAMVSKDMASKNNLKVGSTFTAYSTTLTVAAIFTSGTQAGDNNVIVSLPTEQSLSGQSGDVTSAVATVNSIDNLASATTAIQNVLGSSADITSAETQANQTVQPLNSVKTVSFYSLVGAVIAGSIIILMTMIMIVRERRREIGILKAIGASNLRVMLQFMSEALTFTILGAAIGLIIGVVGGNPVTQMLVSNSTTSTTSSTQGVVTRFGGPGGGGFGGNFSKHAFGLANVGSNLHNIQADIGWSILLYGFGAAVLIAVVGSALAGWMIARVRPSEVMRSE
jgi:putative ABC transport system permease protein